MELGLILETDRAEHRPGQLRLGREGGREARVASAEGLFLERFDLVRILGVDEVGLALETAIDALSFYAVCDPPDRCLVRFAVGPRALVSEGLGQVRVENPVAG